MFNRFVLVTALVVLTSSPMIWSGASHAQMDSQNIQPQTEVKTTQNTTNELSGTSWQLVQFQGSDDTILLPDDRQKYTLTFNADGTVNARIDCNQGQSTWQSSGTNQLQFGILALTRAMCPPGSRPDRIVGDWEYVRSYVVRDSHLFLSLMADGGIYEFEPLP